MDDSSPGDSSDSEKVLYDFLYKDAERIASYYAQLFAGRLSSVEHATSNRDVQDATVKGSAGVVGGEAKTVSETLRSVRRVVDPHDLAVTNVLSYLLDNGHISGDINGAPDGSLVLVSGTLLFLDQLMLKLSMEAFAQVSQSLQKPKNAAEREEQRVQRLGLKMMEQLTVPSAFMLEEENGYCVGGTVKESGMQEPINTYYFRHGNAGLTGVHAIGVKEDSVSPVSFPGSPIISVGLELTKALKDLLFPETAIRITPIVIFRELFQSQSQ